LVVRFNGFRRRLQRRSVEGFGIFGTVPGQDQQGFQRLASQNPSERFVKMKSAAVGDTTEAYSFFCSSSSADGVSASSLGCWEDRRAG
jgi:hypothetical protein